MWLKNPIFRSGRRRRSTGRHQLELIVVDPDGGTWSRLGGGRLGEAVVDAQVGIPPMTVEMRRDDHVVVEGPEGRVGEALVEVLDLFVGELHADEVHAVGFEGLVRAAGGA